MDDKNPMNISTISDTSYTPSTRDVSTVLVESAAPTSTETLETTPAVKDASTISLKRNSKLNRQKAKSPNSLDSDKTQPEASQSARAKSIAPVGKFLSINFLGRIEHGTFDSVNDVYIKYSVVAGPDWIINGGTEVGITQISRYSLNEYGSRKFVWNQPINLSYRTYNYYGWPKLVLSVYFFDMFGNDQILGYGCVHLPVTKTRYDCAGVQSTSNQVRQLVDIHAPQPTSIASQLIGLVTGRRPELIDANLYARGDCRNVLQTLAVGSVVVVLDLATKDSTSSGYNTGVSS